MMTKQEHTEYTRQWRLLRNYKFKVDVPEMNKYSVLPVNEETREIEDTYCTFFGCGKILTLFESHCGNKCIKHVHKVEIDIMRYIKIK